MSWVGHWMQINHEEAGISPKNARRNVARSMAAVMWGMWKNGGRVRSGASGPEHELLSAAQASDLRFLYVSS